MLIFHGTLCKDEFLLWAESDLPSAENSKAADTIANNAAVYDTSIAEFQLGDKQNIPDGPASTYLGKHKPELLPFAATYAKLREALRQSNIALTLPKRQNAQTTVWLPTIKQGAPLASSPMIGLAAEHLDETAISQVVLIPWIIPGLRLSTNELIELLCSFVDREQLGSGILIGQDLQFWALSMRFAGTLVGKQHFLPGVRVSDSAVVANWDPIFLGEDGDKLIRLVKGMPGICLACDLPISEDNDTTSNAQYLPARNLLIKFLNGIVDCLVRKSDKAKPMLPLSSTIDSAQASGGIHSRWLTALLGADPVVQGTVEELAQLCDQIAEWRRPVEIASDTPYRLCFRLEEPDNGTFDFETLAIDHNDKNGRTGDLSNVDHNDKNGRTGDLSNVDHNDKNGGTGDLSNDKSPEREPVANYTKSPIWHLKFLLQSLQDPSMVMSVETALSRAVQELQLFRGGRVSTREYLFRSLGQAVRLCPNIAKSFDQKLPSGITLDTNGAYDFLTHKAPVLKNAGFSIQLPSWWTNKGQPVSATIKMNSGTGLLSRDDIAQFNWQLALGPTPVSVQELEALVQLKMPLLNINNNWVELNPEQIQPILSFFKKEALKKASGQELIKMALGGVKLPAEITFGGIIGDSPIVDLVNKLQGHMDFEQIEPHNQFCGSLRPYQIRGLSWLAFLHKVGFGACLADDMGLGKTIQTLAFIQLNRHETNKKQHRPSLLVCPTSVLSNWEKEAAKFTPNLKILVHHGLDRRRGKDFIKESQRSALVLTSYSLLHRDKEDLKSINWQTIILDEAQNIKNPEAHQTKAALSLRSNFRLALTGTPVENSVNDLWSLMHFLNPGFLGRQVDFKERFFIPIQVYQDQEKLQQLKQLTAPFILRRLKADKTIVPDLPEKLERKTRCHLTKEQASLYAAVVEEATKEIDSATGMYRKSLVLTTLLRLKQICNHPALFLPDRSKIAGRSGKLKRLTELLKEVLATGERALVFTQFKQMGSIIQSHIQATLGKEVVFLHGGIDRTNRNRMVQRFQSNEDGPPIFVLSLKAGGTGLNLTRANHVFHFDRWWNPAVEDQATDRAFRIGQTNNVQVHKFVCAGTMEDNIDEIIESKKILASSTIGAGERWLTELSTTELRSVFSLRDTVLVD